MFKVRIRFVRRIQFARKGDDGALDAGGYGRASPGLVLFYQHADRKRIGWIYLGLFGSQWLKLNSEGYEIKQPWSRRGWPRTATSIPTSKL